MASLRKENDRGRSGWRLRFYLDKKRKSLWLGAMSKRAAESVMRHVDELVRARNANTSPDPDTSRWAAGLEGRIRETLEGWGVIDAAPKRNSDEDRFLGQFCDKYISGRTDVSAATRSKYGHTRRFLVGMFGAEQLLKSITKADAKTWQRWLLAQPGSKGRTMAESTASKHVKRAKTIFAGAMDARLIDENPMDAIKGGDEVNRNRDHFVDRSDAAKVLQACPDHDWRLTFAFARFGGMRVCELLSVTWADIQWSENRIRIDSPKTGLRFAPIYPELLPILESAFDAAPDGQVRCLARWAKDANLGTHMNRIIERAGLVPWEKTFQNLRATRRTELQESFPDHVINAWMGQSSKVAAKSYLQVTPDHWAAGATKGTGSDTAAIGGPTGGPIPADMDHYRASTETKKPRKTLGSTGSGWSQTGGQAPPAGLSQTPETLGNRHVEGMAVPLAVPLVLEDEQTEELLTLWQSLDAAGRADLLAIAKGMAMVPK